MPAHRRGPVDEARQMPPVIGRSLDRYRITAKLGEGGMSTVWLAEHMMLRDCVVLKVLAPWRRVHQALR